MNLAYSSFNDQSLYHNSKPLKNVYLISEYVATALTYAYENNKYIKNEEILNFVFVDIGYLCTTCSYVIFTKVQFNIFRINVK